MKMTLSTSFAPGSDLWGSVQVEMVGQYFVRITTNFQPENDALRRVHGDIDRESVACLIRALQVCHDQMKGA